MLFGKNAAFLTVFFALSVLAIASLPAQADILARNTAGGAAALSAPGQSVTTPSGGSFDTLTFNWYDANLAPTAAGTLFLLDQEYAGKAGDLSSATAGFVASSQSIAGGEYVFDPTITLQGATQYFFYTNQNLIFSGAGDKYPGGILYLPINNDINNNMISLPRLDADFRLSGTPVGGLDPRSAVTPEPSTLAFLACAALTGAAFLRRRKQAGRAA